MSTIEPTRILYFGSRTWVDVPGGWTERQTHNYIRRHREPPFVSGPRWLAIHEQVMSDLDEYESFVLIEGEADGADIASRAVAEARHVAVATYPVDTRIDGPWPAAGHRRNERMAREGKPTAARGFISGKIGEPLSRGSAGMLGILLRMGVPVIVHREDGIERRAA